VIRVIEQKLLPKATAQLAAWQEELNKVPSYEARVARGKEDFKRYNTTRNLTFRHVRDTLASMCPGARRCAYCQHSTADEIDHVRPKDLYPEQVFAWPNYVYSCGICNGVKGAQWAVFAKDGSAVDLTRPARSPPRRPAPGAPLFIDPRAQDPEPFLALDLVDTFLILPRRGLSRRDRRRAEYTIAILGLAAREDLAQARAVHYESYRARLREYITWRQERRPQPMLERARGALRDMDHPFVWFEMKRQHAGIPELGALFAQVPEALRW
jgi:uncharacterized protein (TIGR02646 family)